LRAQQQALIDAWPEIKTRLESGVPETIAAADRDAFMREWEKVAAASVYTQAVSALSASARNAGAAWLQAIVHSAAVLWTNI
jgi:hypothetical protein